MSKPLRRRSIILFLFSLLLLSFPTASKARSLRNDSGETALGANFPLGAFAEFLTVAEKRLTDIATRMAGGERPIISVEEADHLASSLPGRLENFTPMGLNPLSRQSSVRGDPSSG